MKKYIGTKEIEAQPMTMGEAFTRKILPINRTLFTDQRDKPGYHVKYKDGWQDWVSKEEFDNIYKLADTALDRILIEGDELTVKIQKLHAFSSTSKFNELDTVTKAMLVVQAGIMQDYREVLNQRYTKMESGEGSLSNLSFSVAITLLKAGYAVRRTGWNGKGMFIIKQVPAHIESDVISKMQSLPQSAKGLILKGKGFIDYTSQCLIYNENTGRADSWTPSISDVFAEDWEIVE